MSQSLSEFIGVDLATRSFIKPLWQNVRPLDGIPENSERSNFTTVLQMWDKRSGLDSFSSEFRENKDTPASVSTSKFFEEDEDKAKDSLTPSNIALLALPLVLSLVPVALIADVDSTGIFVYTVFTDVLTAVPFIIKGFELMSISSRGTEVEQTWVQGGTGDTILFLEMTWTKCTIQARAVGIVFVSIGFSFLVFGIVAEIVALRFRRKWQRNGTLHAGALRHCIVYVFGGNIEPQ